MQKILGSRIPQSFRKNQKYHNLDVLDAGTPAGDATLAETVSADTNVKPEDAFDGKIIIVDLPVQEFRLVGRIANLTWKYCFQVAVLRRTPLTAPDTYLRPVFLWADEAQNFVTNFDAEYQAVARSAGGCTVYLTQNRESYLRVLKNDAAVDSLLGNLAGEILLPEHRQYQQLGGIHLGQRWVKMTSTTAGQQRNDGTKPQNEGNHSSGVTRAEQMKMLSKRRLSRP